MDNKKSIFVFIGPPGSGKGSLSALCVKELHWRQLSTGNVCRKHILEQTPLGKEMDAAIKSGNLVQDSTITAMVEDWLSAMQDDERSIILDGYPRSVGQAKAFNDILKTSYKEWHLNVVLFSLSDEQLIVRLSNRLMCQNKECQAVYSMVEGSGQTPKNSMTCQECGGLLGRRADDQEDAIKVRLEMYHKHTQPLIDFYKSINQPIIEVCVDAPLHEIFEEFKHKVGCK